MKLPTRLSEIVGAAVSAISCILLFCVSISSAQIPMMRGTGEWRDLTVLKHPSPTVPGGGLGKQAEPFVEIDTATMIGTRLPKVEGVPQAVNFHLVLEQTNTPLSREATLSIYPDQTVWQVGLDTIDFDIAYNGGSLTYEGDPSTKIGGILDMVVLGTPNVWSRTPPLHVHIVGSDLILDPTYPVFRASFRTDVAETTTTMITIENLALNPTNPTYMTNVLNATADSVSFSLDFRCGDSVLQRALLGKNPFGIAALAPNPASHEVRVTLEKPVDAIVQYLVTDALGRVVARGETSNSTLSLLLDEVPNGTCFLRMVSNGFAASKQFVVQR